jgi:hypothetical protein
MSLTYDLTTVKDRKEKYPNKAHEDGEESMNDITHMLIFSSMVTGIGEITSKNAQEVFSRIRMSEMVHGGYFHDANGGRRNITLQEVTDHVGLKTNAGNITKAKFHGWIIRALREKAESEMS